MLCIHYSPHTPSMATERSISHFTASYTFLCHSQLQLHSSCRLAQQRRPQGSCPSLPPKHTYTCIHLEHRPCELRHCLEVDGCFVLIRQPGPESWRYLQSARLAHWKEGFTQLWNIDTRSTPTFWPHLCILRGGGEAEMEGGGRMWSGGICFANDDENV